ncbi:hypothetical protein KIN20_023970 [Parelaphostrongylus tenuis]|uniref:Uncharacterized protein n=1 Tax=Parelaphostrongylus tenuis TaxID=148309 RepID=A0AAD5NCJ3_PARTN|nr:hypothetical protein KIN20_023970 [Parelaphostrongylus tenuis]
MSRPCIIIGITVTAICATMGQAVAYQLALPQGQMVTITPVTGALVVISETISVWDAFFFLCNSFCIQKFCIDHKHYYGQLVENDVAKCTEPSDSDVGIGTVWLALLLGNWHCSTINWQIAWVLIGA